MTRSRTWAVGAFALLALGGASLAAVLLANSDEQGRPVAAPPSMRTVIAYTAGADPAPSEPGLTLRTRIVRGRVPANGMQGTVLTDEDCAPDASGISHCLNKIRLANGTRLVVRHPHDMHMIPCLAPGERVSVTPA